MPAEAHSRLKSVKCLEENSIKGKIEAKSIRQLGEFTFNISFETRKNFLGPRDTLSSIEYGVLKELLGLVQERMEVLSEGAVLNGR